MSEKKKSDFSTGVWKGEVNGSVRYSVGKPVLIDLKPGQYWVNVYPNTRKEPGSRQPDATVTLNLAQARYDSPSATRDERVQGVLSAAQSMSQRTVINPNDGHPGASNKNLRESAAPGSWDKADPFFDDDGDL